MKVFEAKGANCNLIISRSEVWKANTAPLIRFAREFVIAVLVDEENLRFGNCAVTCVGDFNR